MLSLLTGMSLHGDAVLSVHMERTAVVDVAFYMLQGEMIVMLQADSSSAESSSSDDSSSAYETDSDSPDSRQLITCHLFVTGKWK